MAGLYHGHILEFPQIRVDCFTQAARTRPHLIPALEYGSELCSKLNEQKPPCETSRLGKRYEAPEAQYYLLTHAHTDHLTGLSNLHDNCTIICSEETKALLLNYERIKDRKVYDTALAAIIAEAVKGDHGEYWVKNEIKKRGLTEKKVYEGLRGREKEVGSERIWVDCIRTIPFNQPIPLTLSGSNGPAQITLVMLDANHCPGSSMFLISSPLPPYTAVLHTGDVRADEGFLQALIRNPLVQPFFNRYPLSGIGAGLNYIPQTLNPLSANAVSRSRPKLSRRLDRIYLDTSAVIGTCDMPSREEAISGLIQLIELYPSETIFHLHCWTFGYEEVLKAIARVFDEQIHLDRWRLQNFSYMRSDQLLQMSGTTDKEVRFHACERSDWCETIWKNKERVVTIEFVEEKMVEYAFKMKQVKDQIVKASSGALAWPKTLYCPLARHAPLPELQALVALFKPGSLSPNTLLPALHGCDYYALIGAFRDHLSPGGDQSMQQECLEWFAFKMGVHSEAEVRGMARIFFRLDDLVIFPSHSGNVKRERVDGTRSRSPSIEYVGTNSNAHGHGPLKRGRRSNQRHQAAAFLSITEGVRTSLDTGKTGLVSAPRSASTLALREGWIEDENRGYRYDPPGEHFSSEEDTEEENERSRLLAMAESRSKRKRLSAKSESKAQLADTIRATNASTAEPRSPNMDSAALLKVDPEIHVDNKPQIKDETLGIIKPSGTPAQTKREDSEGALDEKAFTQSSHGGFTKRIRMSLRYGA